jgi:hypothetical protein
MQNIVHVCVLLFSLLQVGQSAPVVRVVIDYYLDSALLRPLLCFVNGLSLPLLRACGCAQDFLSAADV